MTANRPPKSRQSNPIKVRDRSALAKKNRMTVRFTDAELEAITAAAEKLSQQRGEIVDEATIVREMAMPQIRSLLVGAA